MKIGRLRIGVQATNEDHRKTVAAWCHPGGYWRWHLSWYPNSTGFQLIKAGYSGNWTPGGWTSIWRGIFRGHFSCHGTLPFIGGWSFSTQPPYPH